MNVFIGNDNVITLDQAFDLVEQEFIDAATVTVTLLDRKDVEIDGQEWPVAMGYVEESQGQYRAVLDDALDLTENQRLIALIELDAGSGKRAMWRVPCVATYRAS